MHPGRLVPLIALAGGLASIDGQSRPLVAPAAAAIYQRLLPEISRIKLYPTEFKNVLRRWLEFYPEKVTFGTDAFPYNEALGVEEVYWMGVHTSRTALAAALAEMIAAREISETQALAMARGYLHDNAAALYK